MLNCKKSNIFAVTYKAGKDVKKQHFVANSLLEVTANFHKLYPKTELLNVNLAADVVVLNTFDLNLIDKNELEESQEV